MYSMCFIKESGLKNITFKYSIKLHMENKYRKASSRST